MNPGHPPRQDGALPLSYVPEHVFLNGRFINRNNFVCQGKNHFLFHSKKGLRSLGALHGPVHEAYAPEDVVQTRGGGENGGGEEQGPDHAVPGKGKGHGLKEEDRENGHQLQNRRYFAHQGGPDLQGGGHDGEDGDPDEDDAVPADDDDGQPAGDDLLHREGHETAHEERLVGDGVEIGTQERFLVEDPGQETVQTVRDPRDHDQDQGLHKGPLHEKDDDDRHQDDPQDRQGIGDVHPASPPGNPFSMKTRGAVTALMDSCPALCSSPPTRPGLPPP